MFCDSVAKEQKQNKTKRLCFHQRGTKWIHCCCFSWCCFSLLDAADASEACQISISSTGGSVAPHRFHSRSPAAAGDAASACGGREMGGKAMRWRCLEQLFRKKNGKGGWGGVQKKNKNWIEKTELRSVGATHWIWLLEDQITLRFGGLIFGVEVLSWVDVLTTAGARFISKGKKKNTNKKTWQPVLPSSADVLQDVSCLCFFSITQFADDSLWSEKK